MKRTSDFRILLPSLAVLALLSVACDPDESTEETGSSETAVSTSGSTMAASSLGDDAGSHGSTGDSGSTGASVTATSSDGGTSSGTDAGSTGSDGGSTGADPGSTGTTGGPPPPGGDWVDCFAGEDCDSPDATCTMIPQSTGATCTFAPDPVAGCLDASDCPAAPPTGNATVACGNADLDPQDECYLDCSGGQTCPDGQECFVNQFCGFPTVDTAGPYEACDGVDVQCEQNWICLTDGTPATAGSCIAFACNSVASCPAGPPGSTVACGDVAPVLFGNECHLACTVDADCPAGGTCLDGQACLFPIP